MRINIEQCQIPISPEFAAILEQAVADSSVSGSNGVIINFRDESYSAEAGGFHPVEVMVDGGGVLVYVTDFSYMGAPPFAELVKELDFDFENMFFGHLGRDYPIENGRELFLLFQKNFVAFHAMSVYRTKVTPC